MRRPSDAPGSVIGRRSALWLLVGAAGLTSACMDPPPPAPPPITYDRGTPIQFLAERVELRSTFLPGNTAASVENRLPVPPEVAARRWAARQLQAVGGPHNVVVTLLDASVLEVPLQTQTGLSGALRREVARRYEANLHLRLDVFDRQGTRRGTITSRSEFNKEVLENTPQGELDVIFQTITQQLIDRMDASVRQLVAANLGDDIVKRS